ncbi:thioredoxin-like associated protein 1, putative [Plasmodium berghei]|uniref:Thioredoxin-like associated protein 1, putative n=2 Tax=Plasmodium berghei TaxID=5821 RepID=A0A509AS18_PLABA|nr:thioredoxin-like associated protein 1, putative [Plasmodium berghei ANKA]CXJ24046.1 thioredoxin-like associated protein 1, putative [Plasmodium berghei]SCM26769.1 thioredoxin-like associated protein 1, putative [Plasmodium berghei]SCN28628.1 thioredoxin-like associated protein 1, putative [Plasmodium berghei]SCO62829.1 thioredoxin-like associated protein 1, putative [Plasmodium berghei]SCO64376.1 thioredoxin-like associated protein 1, putative [Plasmodium berghei]|eukprot:XP_034424272.1 thioredoxin-like associated protein 1, putative [Plasmodium berghei ANKA]
MFKYTNNEKNGEIPQGLENRQGKKLVVENCGLYMDKNKNAGVVCNRITELNLNSRKKISYIKGDSSQMKNILNHVDHKELEIHSAKRLLTSYSTYDNQQKYFETKLVPDMQGKMSICVGRKSGSATVNINIDEYDLEKTYHTWKKIMGKSAPHNKSNLENDRFLTVSEDAERSDKLPIVKNRNPPHPNPDGPFEKERLNLPKQARDNLDRTLTPLSESNQPNVRVKKNNNIYKDSFFLLRPNEKNIPDENKGVRRTNFPWINSNRIKNILNYNYEENVEKTAKINDNMHNIWLDNQKNNSYYPDHIQHKYDNFDQNCQLNSDHYPYRDEKFQKYSKIYNANETLPNSDVKYNNKEYDNVHNYDLNLQKENVSHFGSNDKTIKNQNDYYYLENKNCCNHDKIKSYNVPSELDNTSHEYINSYPHMDAENFNAPDKSYRAPSMTDIS